MDEQLPVPKGPSPETANTDNPLAELDGLVFNLRFAVIGENDLKKPLLALERAYSSVAKASMSDADAKLQPLLETLRTSGTVGKFPYLDDVHRQYATVPQEKRGAFYARLLELGERSGTSATEVTPFAIQCQINQLILTIRDSEPLFSDPRREIQECGERFLTMAEMELNDLIDRLQEGEGTELFLGKAYYELSYISEVRKNYEKVRERRLKSIECSKKGGDREGARITETYLLDLELECGEETRPVAEIQADLVKVRAEWGNEPGVEDNPKSTAARLMMNVKRQQLFAAVVASDRPAAEGFLQELENDLFLKHDERIRGIIMERVANKMKELPPVAPEQ